MLDFGFALQGIWTMVDNFKGTASGLDAPASRAVAVTPNDSADLGEVSRGIWVGNSGDLAVVMNGNASPVTIPGVPNGTLLPLRVARVMATGTTATGIVSLA